MARRTPLMAYTLKDFGSYTAGGRLHHVTQGTPREISFTRDVRFMVDPRGHFAVEQAYVQFFIPSARNAAPPVVLVHGGGMSGACWETTPDGRPGWLHLLLQRGHEVHVVDAVERGRAGFAPGLWEGEPLLRSMEEAWSLFRLGAPEGFAARSPFPGQQFPVGHLEAFARSFVPRWLGTAPMQAEAMLAVLGRTGPALVICHSQGSELVFDVQARRPDLFAGIVALEPSAMPADASTLDAVPVTLVAGDHLDRTDFWRARQNDWHRLSAAVPTARLIDTTTLGGGNSHILMMDLNSEAVLDAALAVSRAY